MQKELIQRAIDSARARIYKLADDEKKNPSLKHQKKIERQKEVMEVTVEALERMLPKKPEIKNDLAEGYMVCPTCGKGFGREIWKEEISDLFKCCKECGQAIDWSE